LSGRVSEIPSTGDDSNNSPKKSCDFQVPPSNDVVPSKDSPSSGSDVGLHTFESDDESEDCGVVGISDMLISEESLENASSQAVNDKESSEEAEFDQTQQASATLIPGKEHTTANDASIDSQSKKTFEQPHSSQNASKDDKSASEKICLDAIEEDSPKLQLTGSDSESPTNNEESSPSSKVSDDGIDDAMSVSCIKNSQTIQAGVEDEKGIGLVVDEVEEGAKERQKPINYYYYSIAYPEKRKRRQSSSHPSRSNHAKKRSTYQNVGFKEREVFDIGAWLSANAKKQTSRSFTYRSIVKRPFR